jgi:hypothetical protein
LHVTTTGSYKGFYYPVAIKANQRYFVSYKVKVADGNDKASVATRYRTPGEMTAYNPGSPFTNTTEWRTAYGVVEPKGSAYAQLSFYSDVAANYYIDDIVLKEAYEVKFTHNDAVLLTDYWYIGKTITLPECSAIDGMTFKGWKIGDAETVYAAGEEFDTFDADTTFTAVYEVASAFGLTGMQILSGTTIESTVTDLRLLCGLNSIDYKEAGFILSTKDTIDTLEEVPEFIDDDSALAALKIESTYAYGKITAAGETILPSKFNANYLLALEIKNFAQAYFAKTLYITPYAIKNPASEDQTELEVVYGETSIASVNDIIAKQ